MEPKRILVVDDDENLARLAIDNLNAEGFQTLYAKDGIEAMEVIIREIPDLVLLDISMPRKDGYEVFKDIKSDVFLSNIPVIMMTAKSKLQEKVFGLDLGVDDYITKPYNIEELIARVKMILKRTSTHIDANPLTKLPGNSSIENLINERIATQAGFAVF